MNPSVWPMTLIVAARFAAARGRDRGVLIAMPDAACCGGPIYAAVTRSESLWLAVTLSMTGVLLLIIYLGGASLIAWST